MISFNEYISSKEDLYLKMKGLLKNLSHKDLIKVGNFCLKETECDNSLVEKWLKDKKEEKLEQSVKKYTANYNSNNYALANVIFAITVKDFAVEYIANAIVTINKNVKIKDKVVSFIKKLTI